MHIENFTGPGCGYCDRAKALMAANGLSYTERDMAERVARAEFAEKLPREKALRQVFVDGTHIGGYEDLRIRLSTDERR